ELKELPSAQSNGVPVDAIDCGHDTVAHSAGAVQENGGAQDPPRFFAARSSKRFEFLPLLNSKVKRARLVTKGINHSATEMFYYIAFNRILI
ncbi:MAG TPA: hypothetical protein VM120_15200, partial [Bryobacteraceae bacterium]|nr:hypothetical protein [Bryobacteraceae bacterium]